MFRFNKASFNTSSGLEARYNLGMRVLGDNGCFCVNDLK